MKNILHRVISFILSLCLVITISLSCYVPVHAGGFLDYLDGLSIDDYIAYWASQVGVLLDSHDFSQWVQNNTAYEDYFNKEHIKFDESTNTVTYDKEFNEWLKNWLINYQKQHETYYIGHTFVFNHMKPVDFDQNNVYQTIQNLIADSPSGVISTAFQRIYSSTDPYVSVYLAVYDDFKDVGFVKQGSADEFNVAAGYSYSTWGLQKFNVYLLNMREEDKPITSIDEFIENATVVLKDTSSGTYVSTNYRQKIALEDYASRSTAPRWSVYSTSNPLYFISANDTSFRVFYSTADLFDYSLGKRSIYFSSDFWDYEPGDITVNMDELEDSLNNLDKTLEKLLDKIDDRTSEKEIEDLLKQILEEMKNNGSGSGGGTGGSSGDYEGFFDDISDFLKKIYARLGDILDEIKNFDLSEKLSEVGSYLKDILKEIKDLDLTGQGGQDLDDVVKSMDRLNDSIRELVKRMDKDTSSGDDIEEILQQILEELKKQGGQDLDDVVDSMDSIDDKLQELLDSINDGMSNDDIEEILRKILDALNDKEVQDSDDVVERLDSLEETLNEILEELRGISKDDGLFGDLFDLLYKILIDPETGSQDMVDALSTSFIDLVPGLTKKFPFCIPWDLYRLFNILAGSGGTETVSVLTYDTGPGQAAVSSLQQYGTDVQVYAGKVRDAPYFELPIVIERYGIDERIIVDMEPFTPISTLSRFLFTVVFCVGLIKFTIKFSEILKGVFE